MWYHPPWWQAPVDVPSPRRTLPWGSDSDTCPGHEEQTLLDTWLESPRRSEPHTHPVCWGDMGGKGTGRRKERGRRREGESSWEKSTNIATYGDSFLLYSSMKFLDSCLPSPSHVQILNVRMQTKKLHACIHTTSSSLRAFHCSIVPSKNCAVWTVLFNWLVQICTIHVGDEMCTQANRHKGVPWSLSFLALAWSVSRPWQTETVIDREHQSNDHRLITGFPQASGPVAQRIRHLITDQGIPGSNPGRVDFFSFSQHS